MAEEKQKTIDFFISYNGADEAWAVWIAWQLEEKGFSTKIQAWDFRPGANFVLEMQKATAEARRTISVLSPNYLSGIYAQPEWAAAFGRDPRGEKGILIPVMVIDCIQELEGLLTTIIHINLVGLSEQEAFKALLEGINIGRNKPDTPPVFPGAIKHNEASQPHFPGNSTDETRSSEKMSKVVNSNSITQQTNLPDPDLVSSENVLNPEPTLPVNKVEQRQQPDTIHVGSKQPSQTAITSVSPSSSSLPLTNPTTPKEDVQEPVELSERLKRYRNKLAKMEVTLDLGGSLTEDFARELQQLLREIISTIRTIPTDTSFSTIATYFKSRDGVLNYLRQANNQLRLAFDALPHPFLTTIFS
ncbi:MAG TPA: toll/interleukin-1 receptor domain-containing protein, partial [Methylomirabilota bacterium]|nr:toll/interleukin-1 receptor domain-containing protein [Methylomirabilota bacterium]